MISDSGSYLLQKYKGCLLGAVLGDALGMPHETLPVHPPQPLTFKKAYRGHPNELLLPGQYTDDGQIILISARILTESPANFNGEAYAKELLRTHLLHKFRYADGAVIAACKKMDSSKNLLESGINSDTAGCIALSIPFALGYANKREMAKELSSACCITHANVTAQAGAVGLSLFLKTLIDTGDTNAAFKALDSAAENMCPELASRLSYAHRLVSNGVPLSSAAAELGTSSQITQIIPLSVYLCRMFSSPTDLLTAAVSCGGNAGTVAMICGAFVGARYGFSALPLDMVQNVERAGIFNELAEKLCQRAFPAEPVSENAPEKDDDTAEEEKTEESGAPESGEQQ